MVGMGTPLTGDAPPFCKVFGTPPRIRGANAIALKRVGVSVDESDRIDFQYRTSSWSDEWLSSVIDIPELSESYKRFLKRATRVIRPVTA